MSTSNINQLKQIEPQSPAGKYPDKIRSLPLFDGAFDAYKLSAENCEVLFASYPAGSTVDPHTHDTENHGLVTRGELILTIDGIRTHYGIGDWYHVPAEKIHQADFEHDTDTIELWFDPNS